MLTWTNIHSTSPSLSMATVNHRTKFRQNVSGAVHTKWQTFHEYHPQYYVIECLMMMWISRKISTATKTIDCIKYLCCSDVFIVTFQFTAYNTALFWTSEHIPCLETFTGKQKWMLWEPWKMISHRIYHTKCWIIRINCRSAYLRFCVCMLNIATSLNLPNIPGPILLFKTMLLQAIN